MSATFLSTFLVLAKSVILFPITKSKSSSGVNSLPSGVVILFIFSAWSILFNCLSLSIINCDILYVLDILITFPNRLSHNYFKNTIIFMVFSRQGDAPYVYRDLPQTL